MLPSLPTSGNQCKEFPHQCISFDGHYKSSFSLLGTEHRLGEGCENRTHRAQLSFLSSSFSSLLGGGSSSLGSGGKHPAGAPALESAPPTASPHHQPAKACFKENTKHAAKRYSLTVYFCLKLFHISLYTATEQ